MKYPTLTVVAITSGNILGPLILFGGVGLALSQHFNNKVYVLVGIFIAFFFSNFLILTTTSKYMKSISKK